MFTQFYRLLKIWIASILLIGSAAVLYGSGSDSGGIWDPFRLRVQLTAEAMAEMKLSGPITKESLPAKIQQYLPEVGRLNSRNQAVQVRPVFRTPERFQERHRSFGLDRWIEIEFANVFNIPVLQSEYLAASGVEWAEPVYTKLTLDDSDFPNDSLFPQQWSLNNTGQGGGTLGADISMKAAWGFSTGDPSVVVLVVDSGINSSHPDLTESLWINPNPGSENGYDGDLNGWNFAQDNSDIGDTSGHGTQVAGIIGASTNNITGIAGIAGGTGEGDGVRLMVARTFTSSGNGGFAEALVYGADNGAVIASNSWGYTAPNVFEQVVLDAIDYFITFAGKDEDGNTIGSIDGGVVIFAAGNSGTNEIFYPAAYAPVVAVASTDRNDLKAVSSTYGNWIDLSAPGNSILTTHRNGNYLTVSGTSFACPHVSGVAALLASRFPGIASDVLINRILDTTDPLNSINPEFNGLLGSGRLNAFRALDDDPLEPPSSIDDLTISEVSQTEFLLEWTAPGSSGQSGRATSYDLRIATTPITGENFDNATSIVSTPTPSIAGTFESFTLDGLQPDTTYWVALRAIDFFDNQSDISNVPSATTWGIPSVTLTPLSFDVDLETGEQSAQTLQFENTGEGPLVFQNTTEILPQWLSIEPASGMVMPSESNSVVLSIDAEGLANGIYQTTIEFSTNDPLNPTLEIVLQATVTGGTPLLTLTPQELNFGEVFVGFPEVQILTISNPGTDVLSVSSIEIEGEGFFLDQEPPLSISAGATVSIEVTFLTTVSGSFSGVLNLVSDASENESVQVNLSALALEPPVLNFSPQEVERTVPHNATETVTLTIQNDGLEDLIYSLQLLPTLSENSSSPHSGYNAELLAERSPEDRINPVDLILDDGEAEDNIGLTNGGEFLWLNQFTPEASDFPFVLTHADLFFPESGNVEVGEKFDLYVFKSQSEVPDETAILIRHFRHLSVSVIDDWNRLQFPTPLYLNEPANILVGLVNREAGLNGFPAAVDLSSESNGRSWIATYANGVPEVPTFPADGLWGLIDDFGFAGNWLIRGLGHRDFIRIEQQEGIIEGGQSKEIALTIEPLNLLAGDYLYQIVIETNDPAHPLLTVPIKITVTGEPSISVEPEILNFGSIMVGTESTGSLTIRNTGIDTLLVTNDFISNPAFSTDFSTLTLLPGEEASAIITFSPEIVGSIEAELTFTNNDPNHPEKSIALIGESVPPPEVRIDPESLSLSLTRLETVNLNATLFNDGAGPLTFSIKRLFENSQGTITLPIEESTLPPIDFVLDDGTVQDSLGLDGGMQFLWANQFTLTEYDTPFFLERIEVFFDFWTAAEIGQPLDLHVYHVPDGDPENGASLIHSMFDREVKTLDDWSLYELEEPLLIDQRGDILLAVVFRVPLFSGWPATIDTSSPKQKRSWLGIYLGDPSAEPELPANDFWGLVDDLGFAGNWLIRGYGSRALASTDPVTGSILPDEFSLLNITASGQGLSPGQYVLDFLVSSNDPDNPELILPLTLDITGSQSISVIPASIDFGAVRESTIAETTLEVLNSGQDPLKIESLNFDHPSLTLSGASTPLIINPGEPLSFSILLSEDLPGTFEANLNISSDDPKQASLLIPITAEIVSSPSPSWDDLVTFIEAEAGSSGVFTFDLSNVGGSSLIYEIRAALTEGQDDSFGYIWRSNSIEPTIEFGWTDARENGTELTGLAGLPDGSEWVDLPFDFNFYGSEENRVQVSINGWLTFSEFPGLAWISGPLPGNEEPHHLIAPFWDDLSMLNSGQIHVLNVDDDDPHWIVQWSELQRMEDPDSSLTFQVVLWPSGLIEFRYKTMINSSTEASIGVSNSTGEDGLQLAFKSSFAESGKVVRLFPESTLVSNLPLQGEIPAGESKLIEIPYDLSSLIAGYYLQDLVLSFNDDPETSLLIPLEFNISGEPSIATQPNLLNFGTVIIGEQVSRELEILNPGTEKLTVSTLTLNSVIFTLSEDNPFVIPAGESKTIDVVVSPNELGEFTGQLIIGSDAVNNSARTVFLRGSALFDNSVPMATRKLPDWFLPGKALSEIDPLAVRIFIDPDENTGVYLVEDLPPEGWVIDQDSISHEGFLDPINGKVKFGPFFDNEPRMLSYDLQPPLEASGEMIFSGIVSSDGLDRLIEGDQTISFDTRHPADSSPEGFIMTAGAVSAYGAAWKNFESWHRPPQNIPISYVTQAGALWRQGEIYQYDFSVGEAPLWWIPVSIEQPLVGQLGITSANATASTEETYYPGETKTINILVEPGPGVLSYALEEQIPTGWTISDGSISDNGRFDFDSGTLRFGPFFDDKIRNLSYQLIPPEDARGGVAISGVLSFNGITTPTGGQRFLTPPPSSYADWIQKMGSNLSSSDPMADPSGTGISNLLRYALGMNLDSISRERLPRLQFSESPDGEPLRAGLQFTISSTTDDLHLSLEVSTDLQNWSPLPEGNLIWEFGEPENGLINVSVWDIDSVVDENLTRFYRLRVLKD